MYYKLNTRDLLYKSDGTGGPFHAVVRISYESYDAFGSKLLLDSASTIIDDKSTGSFEDKELIGSMDLRRKEHRTFVLKIMARDMNRDQQSTVFLRVEKDGAGIRQYFMPVDTAHGLPLFTDHFKGGIVRVRCEVCAGQELQGAHYPAKTNLPVPVFTSAPSGPAPSGEPDSTFRVTVDSDGRFTLDLSRPGIYHLPIPARHRRDFSLFVRGADAYPVVDRRDRHAETIALHHQHAGVRSHGRCARSAQGGGAFLDGRLR